MKKFHKKSLVLLIAVALLLTISVSGTVAFLADNDGPVTNIFTPASVDVTVTDEIENNTKKNVVVHNNSDIPVYIRVAVVAYWVKDNQIVAPWNDYSRLPIASGWARDSDGFYYYGPTTEKTIPFFTAESSYSPEVTIDGAHLEMDILVQAVQADGMGATSAQDAFAKAANVSSGN